MFAFEITTEDIQNVCNIHFGNKISDEKAKAIFDKLDTDAVEKAALDGGDDDSSQTSAAYNEIKDQIIAGSLLR